MDYPANCRILVLSSSPDLSGNLIHRIIKTENMSDGPFTEWVISNKYYTAPVHFHWPTWTGTASTFESGTPAVLYVFSGKDNYRPTLQVLGQHLKAFELEVTLAVSLPRENEDEIYLDPGELEDICSFHGFEYVEGAMHSVPGEGIHRIVEALHTIMWPSMQQKPSGSPKRKARPKPKTVPKPSLTDPELLENIEWTRFSTDEFHAEKIALEKWLDSDDFGSTDTPVKPPTSTILPNSSSSDGQPHDPARFDDDFSDFVSASAPVPETTDATSKNWTSEVISETGCNQDRDDPDDDLFGDDFFPTDQEILMTSHRIFGPHLPSQRAGSSRSAREDDEGRSQEDEDEGEVNASGDEDFDLSRIMGALQGLKEEISGIGNEEVKRRMAAKVAMGLLYGLEG